MRSGLARILDQILVLRARDYPPEALSRSALVFAPHQDDETLGCGGTIILKKSAGARLGIVFMTDGGTSHSRLMAPETVAEIREQEALSAAGMLGLESSDVHFLRFSSKELRDHKDEATSQVLAILGKQQPEEIFIPHALEPPADHATTNRIVRGAVEQRGVRVQVFEYPIWFWEHFPWMRSHIYNPRTRRAMCRWSLQALGHTMLKMGWKIWVGDVIEQKRRALQEYRSQMTQLVDDPRWQTLPEVSNGDFLARFLGKFEFYRGYILG